MLNQISLFQKLSSEDWAKLEKTSRRMTYSLGETIFSQGESAEYFYIVLTGEIQISRRINNREIHIANYGQDTFFGEMPILAGENHLATGKAVVETLLLIFIEEDFWQML
ncbi:MAG: cyclic nucleotide-binding domain-containing protein, partial [Waterburya sp.]